MSMITLSALAFAGFASIAAIICLWRVGTKLDALADLKPVIIRGRGDAAPPSPEEVEEQRNKMIQTIGKMKLQQEKKTLNLKDPGSDIHADRYGTPTYVRDRARRRR